MFASVDPLTGRILSTDIVSYIPQGPPSAPGLGYESPKLYPIVELFPDGIISNRDRQKYEISYEFNQPELVVNKIYSVVNLPNWEQFNVSILSDADFQAAAFIVDSTVKGMLSALTVALNNVSAKQITAAQFKVYYDQFCATASVTPEVKIAWGALASTSYLPQDFIDIINGN